MARNIAFVIGIFLCTYVSSWAPQMNNAFLVTRKRMDIKAISDLRTKKDEQAPEKRASVVKANWLEHLSSSICGKQNFLKFTMTKNDGENREEMVNGIPSYHDTLLG